MIEAKMCAAGIPGPTIQAFLRAVQTVKRGERGLVPESAIDPVANVPRLDALVESGEPPARCLGQLAVVKLNGGLGTGMGLERAKSLIPVKGQDCFLDFIARQILHLRQATGRPEPAFLLMNSFATRQETLEYLRKYPELWHDETIDFLQNRVPKIDASSYEPVSWPAQPELEWCPPGHGDFYPALLGSGLLDRLLAKGVKYLFVSNSDNLGASVDLKLLRYFAESELSFLMEVAERTVSDRKGGHLARRRATGRLLLRESSQCPKEDEPQFQDCLRHRLFNTNNLWLRLDHLKSELDRNQGILPLPLITNSKTVDPRDPSSPHVLQLESAMGAAIECFEHSGAILVPRSRFAPVKTTADLLGLRSDAYRVREDSCLVLDERRQGRAPLIVLDPAFKVLVDFDRSFAQGPPSLVDCESLTVQGRIAFAPRVVCQGQVAIQNPSAEVRTVPAGTYRDIRVQL